ncbi:hypothetical protein GOP47_0005170 [Adiantum capillus-veneris]|uniref:DNA polymerase n=1 Tax=Adiantum capillus-veneris TaxID=13818 RepID=A0A9D4ZNC7_ADICA|nr:hypothetical protein GOP47_0005170 [Adiantum capillus-veneris]
MSRHKRRADEICRDETRDGQGNPNSSYFAGIRALFIGRGVSSKRLQIWKEKVRNLGGFVVEPCDGRKKRFTHVLANDLKFLEEHSFSFSKRVVFLKFHWIEDCLKEGKILPCDSYFLEETASPSGVCCSEGLATTGPTSVISEIGQNSEKLRASEQAIEEAVQYNEHSTPVEYGSDLELLDAKSGKMEMEESVRDGEPCSDEETAVDASDPSSLNKHITSILREMWDLYESVLGDEWRALTYRKAAIRLEKLPCRISSLEDVKHISGIGSSVIDKIKEILCTGKLQKLEGLKADPKVCTLQHLASVWGVGPKLAQKLYQAGHRSVDDLVKEPSLSQMARIGVKYYKDLVQRIPRDEVAAAEKYVQNIGEGLCPGICINVAGSYRRGNPTCGDIDFLVTHPDGYSHRGFLIKLVEKLRSNGFISEGVHCTDHSSLGTKKVDTFMGVGRVPEFQLFRRLDIKVYPKETIAFALVYFTGNDVLNRKIRYAAQRKGFKLNDQGLYRRYGGKKGLSSTESIPCETEKEVFEKLGFPYYEPCDRNL